MNIHRFRGSTFWSLPDTCLSEISCVSHSFKILPNLQYGRHFGFSATPRNSMQRAKLW